MTKENRPVVALTVPLVKVRLKTRVPTSQLVSPVASRIPLTRYSVGMKTSCSPLAGAGRSSSALSPGNRWGVTVFPSTTLSVMEGSSRTSPAVAHQSDRIDSTPTPNPVS